MDYFDSKKNVEDYVRMADGYDGRELVDRLPSWLPDGATVLELGMGPGKDLDMLLERYRATGSDASQVFVDRYLEARPDADVLLLDAVSLDTARRFDCVYSNKVLHHLTRDGMRASLARQLELLHDGGLALHTLWRGEGEQEMHGLRFVYYSVDEARAAAPDGFEVVEAGVYAEMEKDDSIRLVLRKSAT